MPYRNPPFGSVGEEQLATGIAPFISAAGVITQRENYTDDFVVGSPQLDDDGDPAHDRRMFFDKSKGSFAAGCWSSTQANNMGVFSALFGENGIVSGKGAVHFGLYGFADNYAQTVFSAGAFVDRGDAQRSFLTARRSITHDGSSAGWNSLGLSGGDPASVVSSRIAIVTDTTWTFSIFITGTTSGCAKIFNFKIEGGIKNAGGTVSISSQVVTTLYDADDTDFDARVAADDTNKGLLIQVQDTTDGGDTVRWVAGIQLAEVTYPS